MKNRVLPARPYKPNNLGSMGNASGMLIRQYQFPNEYHDFEALVFSDHDHCIHANYDRAIACIKKYTKTGELGLESWFLHSSDELIMAFLDEFLDVNYGAKWTGYRIRGTVSRSDGSVIWSLELFAKAPGSSTVVYTGTKDVPNVYDY